MEIVNVFMNKYSNLFISGLYMEIFESLLIYFSIFLTLINEEIHFSETNK